MAYGIIFFIASIIGLALVVFSGMAILVYSIYMHGPKGDGPQRLLAQIVLVALGALVVLVGMAN